MLFKQAIAEAKAVREAAIANAKAALEETLTPHLKELLAAKLQEMEGAEEEEEESKHEGMNKMPEYQVAEADEKEEGEEEEKEEKEEEDEIDLENMEVEDLTDLIRKIIAQEMGEDDGEMEDEAEAEMGDAAEMEDEEEAINLDELIAELSNMGNEGKHDSMTNEIGLDENAEDLIKKAIAMGGSAAKKIVDAIGKAIDYTPIPAGTTGKHEGVSKGELEEANAQDLIKKALGMGKEAAKAVVDAIGKAIEYTPIKHGQTGKQEEAAYMNEAKKTIMILRRDLHEVNLLNSKLLYVNKIFKAKNLSEAQKVNVIAAFDKAETVKETKLVYDTISEQFTKAAKKSVNEVKGFASKSLGAPAPSREIISEDATVKRLQKLAGIIK
jgi:hypothetical protein